MKKLFAIILLALGFTSNSIADDFLPTLGSDYGYEGAKVIHQFGGKYTGKPYIRLVQRKNGDYHVEIDSDLKDDRVSIALEGYLEDIRGLNKYVTIVYINSSGGLMSEGMKIGKLFRKHNIDVRVGNKQKCYSACAIAYFGGAYNKLSHSGKLGVHAPYNKNKDGTITCVTFSDPYYDILSDYMKEMIPNYHVRNRYLKDIISTCGTNNFIVYDRHDHFTKDTGR